MDNYIVRIYRRDKDVPEKIAGLVETVGTDETRSFLSLSDLVKTITDVVTGQRYKAESETVDKF